MKCLRNLDKRWSESPVSKQRAAVASGNGYDLSKRRRKYSPAFTRKVAPETVKGKETVAELPAQLEVYPRQIQAWKNTLVEGTYSTFNNGQEQHLMNDELERRRKNTLTELESARNELLKKGNNPRNAMELILVNSILQMTDFSIVVLGSKEQYFPRWFQWIVLSILNPWTGSKYRELLKIQQCLGDSNEEYELVGEDRHDMEDVPSQPANDPTLESDR